MAFGLVDVFEGVIQIGIVKKEVFLKPPCLNDFHCEIIGNFQKTEFLFHFGVGFADDVGGHGRNKKNNEKAEADL